MIENIEELIASHRFFKHIKPEYVQEMVGCASVRNYKTGDVLGSEGSPSDFFFTLLEGRVAIESYQPGLDPVMLQTLHGGEIVGWSWLFPPYEWVFDAKALSDVRTIAFDASFRKHFIATGL
jgi:signal-transduction protein with cAMP-binding, CBS, and nucleotidyltransferase domain